jgi:hypothetical protein
VGNQKDVGRLYFLEKKSSGQWTVGSGQWTMGSGQWVATEEGASDTVEMLQTAMCVRYKLIKQLNVAWKRGCVLGGSWAGLGRAVGRTQQ